MNEFFTPEVLLTFTGQVLFVAMGTQLLKRYLEKVDPKWIALALSVGVSAAAQLILARDWSPSGLMMMGANALAVLSGAVTGYEAGLKPVAAAIAAEKMHGEFEGSERGK